MELRKLLLTKYLFLSLCLFAASLALKITVTNIVLLVLIFAFILHDGFSNFKRGIQEDLLIQSIGAYFFFIFISLFREASLANALDLFVKHALILIPLFFYNLNILESEKKTILRCYIYSVLTACLVGLFKTLGRLNDIEDFYHFSWHLSNDTIFSSNYLALFMAFGIIVIFYSFFENDPLFKRPLAIILISFLFVYLSIFGSRTVFFVMIAICLCFLIYQAIRNKGLFIYVFFILALTITAIFTVPYFRNRIEVLITYGLAADPRHYEYLASYNIFKAHPLFGLGYTGTEKALMDQYVVMGYDEGIANAYNAHSEFIQTVLMFGIVGLIAFVLMYGLLIIKALRLRNFLAIAFAVLFICGSMTESIFERNKGNLFFSFFTGLLIVAGKKKEPSDQSV